MDPKELIRAIENYGNVKMEPQTTLMIWDEIQVCPRALTALKYFAEISPEWYLIAAGSLLGVPLKRENFSFPVGKVQMKSLYPLSFDEFLKATQQQKLLEMIQEHYGQMKALPEPFHQKALGQYYEYLVIGGMPAAVTTFIEKQELTKVREVQDAIQNSYIADMAKYADKTESVKIRACYESLSAQLAKENKKFQFKMVRRGASSTLFGVAIDWLMAAKVVLKCYQIEAAFFPLEMAKDLSAFKLYTSDSGLLSARLGLTPQHLLYPDLLANPQFRGAIFENAVAIALYQKYSSLYYWNSQSKAEIDFLIEINGQVIPVEVKSADNVRSRSLHSFMARYKAPQAIRISSKNFGIDNQIQSIPHYATFLI